MENIHYSVIPAKNITRHKNILFCDLLRGGRLYCGIGFLWHRTTASKVKFVGFNDLHRVVVIEV